MYKLVRQIGDQYFSYVKYTNIYHIEYKINEFVYPKVGKLFVFKDKESATDFLDLESVWYNDDNLKLFKCEIQGEPKKPKSISSMFIDLRFFWNELKSTNYPLYSKIPPTGTLLVDAVKLTEECDND